MVGRPDGAVNTAILADLSVELSEDNFWGATRLISVSLATWLHSPRWLLPFSQRTPQRNRNELGETTVNKT
jgi:hypothetical protein